MIGEVYDVNTYNWIRNEMEMDKMRDFFCTKMRKKKL